MKDREPYREGIIEELRRRKVLRSTTIYAVCGWCLLQWSDFLFEQLGWPEWSVTLVLTAVVLGFPAIVALAWVFDVTPSGVRRTDPDKLLAGVRTPISWLMDGFVLLLFGATIAMLIQEGAGI
jgi:hypothetical protein